MPLSARYRLYALGAAYLAPYVAMLVWCWQDYKLRSMLALGLTAALGALLLAGVTRTWRRFFLAYLPLLVLSIAYAGYSLSYGIVPGHTLSIVLVSASAEEVIGLLTVWPHKWLLLPLLAILVGYVWFALRLPQSPIFTGKTNIAARAILVLAIPVLAYAARSTPQLVDGMALNPIVGSVMFFAGQIPRAEREIHGFNVHKAPFHASRAETNPEVHILIIGESARRASWSVYGTSARRRPTWKTSSQSCPFSARDDGRKPY